MKIIPVQSITLRTLWGRLRLLVFILLTTLTLTNATSGTAAGPKVVNIRLSGDMPDFSSVFFHTVSSDGIWAVFAADRALNDMIELYSVKTWSSGEIYQLSGPLINGGNVSEAKVAPNNLTVVYRADQERNDRLELYSVPITGGSWVKLSGILEYYQNVTWFEISANSQWVIYKVVSSIGSKHPVDLYIAPLTGGSPPIKLNPETDMDRMVIHAEISPNSERVVYLVRSSGGDPAEVYSIRIDGTDRKRLSGMTAGTPGVANFQITPKGERVIYKGIQASEALFSVPVDKQPADPILRLHPALTADFGQHISGYKVSPDGNRVVSLINYYANDRYELFSAEWDKANGGLILQLNGALSGDASVASDFKITPNGKGVVFRADVYRDGSYELFSQYIDKAGAPYHLNPTLDEGESVDVFQVTPNSLGVVYLSDHQSVNTGQLYSISITGPGNNPTRLTNAPPGVEIRWNFQITPNSRSVLLSIDVGEKRELYSVPITGGSAPVKCSVPFQNTKGMALGPILLPDSQSLIYEADAVADERYDLYYAFWGYQFYLPSISK